MNYNDSPIWKEYTSPYQLIDVLVSLKNRDLLNWCRAFGLKQSRNGQRTKEIRATIIFEHYFKRPPNVVEAYHYKYC